MGRVHGHGRHSGDRDPGAARHGDAERHRAGGGDDGLALAHDQAPVGREQVHRVLVVLVGSEHAESGADRPQEVDHLVVTHGPEFEAHDEELLTQRPAP